MPIIVYDSIMNRNGHHDVIESRASTDDAPESSGMNPSLMMSSLAISEQSKQTRTRNCTHDSHCTTWVTEYVYMNIANARALCNVALYIHVRVKHKKIIIITVFQQTCALTLCEVVKRLSTDRFAHQLEPKAVTRR